MCTSNRPNLPSPTQTRPTPTLNSLTHVCTSSTPSGSLTHCSRRRTDGGAEHPAPSAAFALSRASDRASSAVTLPCTIASRWQLRPGKWGGGLAVLRRGP
eukprot:316127-Chlamydomonas_euryale.AAC.2